MSEEQVAALNAALAKAQGEFPSIPRSRTVETGKFSYSYAPLDAILNACRPVLSKHGLAVTQQLEQYNGMPAIRTELRHAGGAVIGSSFPMAHAPEGPQQLGSLLTYLRRYALVALLGVAAEEDDDAQQAQAAPAKKPAAKPVASTAAQRKTVYTLRGRLLGQGLTVEAFEQQLEADYGTSSVTELSREQASALIGRLEEAVRKLEPDPDQEWPADADVPFEEPEP